MDTTKKAQFKTLDPNPFAVAAESFDKAKALDSKAPYFVKDATGFPLLNDQIYGVYANSCFNRAINAYNEKTEDKDKKLANTKIAFEMSERTLYFIPTDTSVLLYAGGVFAPGIQEYDKGISMLRRYIAAGGKLPEAYTMMSNIYSQNKKDNVSALQVLKEGHQKFPNYKDMVLMELNIYLGEKKYDLAKNLVEEEVKADPNNKDNFFLLGQLNRELGDRAKAKDAFKKVIEMDPKSFDASTELANLFWADAKDLKDQMGKLGTSKTDMEKLKELDAKYVEKLKIYIPYIEACEKLNPDDVNVLYSLLNVYGDLDDQPKSARVKKKLKSLGEDVN
jgi:tetratricopeptide (TPR) repeat protein